MVELDAVAQEVATPPPAPSARAPEQPAILRQAAGTRAMAVRRPKFDVVREDEGAA